MVKYRRVAARVREYWDEKRMDELRRTARAVCENRAALLPRRCYKTLALAAYAVEYANQHHTRFVSVRTAGARAGYYFMSVCQRMDPYAARRIRIGPSSETLRGVECVDTDFETLLLDHCHGAVACSWGTS